MEPKTFKKAFLLIIVLAIFAANMNTVSAMYDPHISRFTACDPINGKFTEPLSLHKYLYCWNDPVNYVDPWGNWAFSLGLSLSAFTNLSDLGILSGEASLGSSMVGYYSMVMPYYLAALAPDVGMGATGGLNFTIAHNEAKKFNEGWSWGFMDFIATGASLTNATNASATVDISVSPQAQCVTDLVGNFAEAGFSVTTPPGYLGINALGWHSSVGLYPDNSPNGIYLYTVSVGYGLGNSIAEGHAFVGHTEIWRNLYWTYKP